MEADEALVSKQPPEGCASTSAQATWAIPTTAAIPAASLVVYQSLGSPPGKGEYPLVSETSIVV